MKLPRAKGVFVAFFVATMLLAVSFPLLTVQGSEAPKIMWAKTFPDMADSTKETPIMVGTADGGFVVVATSPDTLVEKSQQFIAKFDSYGNMLWKRNSNQSNWITAIAPTNDGGFVVTGWTNPDNENPNDLWIEKADVVGVEQWQLTWGFHEQDSWGNSIIQNSDGDYVLSAGLADSPALVKISGGGEIEWNTTLSLWPGYVIQSIDGGYAMLGETIYDENYSATHPYIEHPSNTAFFLLKTDSTGAEQWVQKFYANYVAFPTSLVAASDGGYVLGGYSLGRGGPYYSQFIKTYPNGTQQFGPHLLGAGDINCVVQTGDGGYAMVSDGANVLKVDDSAKAQWNISYGNGDIYGNFYSIVRTADDGLAIMGVMELNTNSVLALIKIAPEGYTGPGVQFPTQPTQPTILWENNLVANGSVYFVAQTDDGGYIVAGSTGRGDGIEIGQITHQINIDMYLMKVDSNGNLMWRKTYGGLGNEGTISAAKTSDAGFILAGWTSSWGAGAKDIWLVKTDSAGNLQWNRTYGGPGYDCATHVFQTSDGGYAVTALVNGNASDSNRGFYGVATMGPGTYCLIKTDSKGNIMWNQTFNDSATWVIQTCDGGYALAGIYTSSEHQSEYEESQNPSSKFTLTKTDANGNVVWSQNYTRADPSAAMSVTQTQDGGYLLTCNSYLGSSIMKVDSSGKPQWSRSMDKPSVAVQASDGGYVVSNVASMLFKVDSTGNREWALSYFESGRGGGTSFVALTSDGGAIFAAATFRAETAQTPTITIVKISAPLIPEMPTEGPWLLVLLLAGVLLFVALIHRKRTAIFEKRK